MKISNFKKFHKNRSIYENNIMEPVEDTSEVEGFEYPQAQMNTTTKPDAPTKPLVQPIPPGTKNPNQQPTVTPVKAQGQAQNGRFSQAQAQPSRQAQSRISEPKVDNLEILASKLGIEHTGSNVLNYNDVSIEQYSENGHFAVNGVDTKTSDADKAKIFIDKMVGNTEVKPQTPTKPIAPPMPKETPDQSPVKTPAKAQGSQTVQDPKMMQERRSNKKSNKSRINELNENPYLISGGLNVGGSREEKTDKVTTLNQKLAGIKGQKPGYDTMVNQYTEQTLSTLNSIKDACVDIETNISRLMSSHGYQSIQTILDRCLMEINKLSSK